MGPQLGRPADTTVSQSLSSLHRRSYHDRSSIHGADDPASAAPEIVPALRRRVQQLQEQNEKLEQGKRALERELEQQSQAHASKTERLWWEIRQMEGTLQRKESDAKQLQGQLREQKTKCEVERQRADELQRAVDSSAGQVQEEVQLKAQIETLQQHIRDQKTSAEARLLEVERQANARLLEVERQANADKLRLETTVEELEKRLQEQLEQERTRVPRQGSQRNCSHGDIHSSMESAMPHLRWLMEAYERGNSCSESFLDPTPAIQVATPGEDLSNRLNEQRSAFDQERAQLLQHASDAARTQQDVSRRQLMEREAVLTCPISLELFEDPVVTECCGKTFSSDAWSQARRRSLFCGFCRSPNASVHANRDVAKLVELHRAERSVLGLPDLPPPSPATATTGANSTASSTTSTSRSGSHRERHSTTRQSRHRAHRSERVHERSEVPHHRHSTRTDSETVSTAMQSREARRHSRTPSAAATPRLSARELLARASDYYRRLSVNEVDYLQAFDRQVDESARRRRRALRRDFVPSTLDSSSDTD
ncbi:hypothetical protein PHYSODRAFT_305247 [Phytophthora sojae]|uniref:SP-RING-type domain-containing protein n=1 Tax=Phytophthora sojae (strain P6497) TaxID=1094619 RepID=G5A2I2_PHYSP|nr:hypothetical protein PHYSODRAFT_305247 [Phytophthora sojae]EGZ09873.1 hypothetical protein PHYSODRAFT_305247 [Phytophthora sojae]|eukprot:XP_009534734.1 hypothetical protein PHYSODRAFT_305247 [Phytophthora sojae]